MTRFYRVRLGSEMAFTDLAKLEGFVGVDFGIKEDLTNQLPDNWRDFNKQFIPYLIALDSQKTRVGAGLNSGMTWTLCRGIDVGDYVLYTGGAAGLAAQAASGEVISYRSFIKGGQYGDTFYGDNTFEFTVSVEKAN